MFNHYHEEPRSAEIVSGLYPSQYTQRGQLSLISVCKRPKIDVDLYVLNLNVPCAADSPSELWLVELHPAKLAAVVHEEAAEVCHTGQHSKAPCMVQSRRAAHDQVQA